jgi:hypothetical protein
MSRARPFGHNGSVLLSIVAQALLLYLSYVQVSFFPLPTMSMRIASGRLRLMRAGFCTGIHPRLRVAKEGIPLLGEVDVLDVDRIASA